MRELIMNGAQISNELQFRAQFSPVDLLWQRELAAGFAVQMLAPLSLKESYHSYQLYRAVFQMQPEEELSLRDYGASACPGLINGGDWDLLEELWALLDMGETAAGEEVKLFWILAAGYLLSGKTLKELPLVREEIEAAYHRKARAKVEPDWPDLPEKGEIPLPAREKSYILRLDPKKGAERLTRGAKILPRRLSPAPSQSGISDARVHLEIWEGDEFAEKLTLSPGEYRYCNFAGDVPVFFHPIRVKCGDCVLVRQENKLILERNGKQEESIDCAGQELISIAPEAGGGWVLLKQEGLNLGHYSGRIMNQKLFLRVGNVVEAAVFEDGTLLLLDDQGVVHSTNKARTHVALAQHKFPSLKAALSWLKGANGYG